MTLSIYVELSSSRKAASCSAIQEFRAFYGNRRFVTTFTRAPPTGAYPEPDQSGPHHSIPPLKDLS
jgi:hypothetical protein